MGECDKTGKIVTDGGNTRDNVTQWETLGRWGRETYSPRELSELAHHAYRPRGHADPPLAAGAREEERRLEEGGRRLAALSAWEGVGGGG